METNELIRTLSEDATPVTPLHRPGARAALWLTFALFSLGFVLPYLGGLRYDVKQAIHTPTFIIENIIIIMAAVAAMMAAFRLSLPEETIAGRIKLMIGFATLVWIGLTAIALINASTAELRRELTNYGGIMHCLTDTLMLTALPLLALLIMIRRAAPVHFSWVGYSGLLASLSCAAFACRYLCANDSGAHIFIWHYMPILLIGALGIFLGRLAFKW